jgi:transposase
MWRGTSYLPRGQSAQIDLATARRMRREGYTYRAIAERLGLHFKTIARLLNAERRRVQSNEPLGEQHTKRL